MGPIGMQEMIFIVILALLLVGPKKLPELFRVLGKGMSEFRRAKSELKSTFDTHMRELERETKLAEYKNTAISDGSQYNPYAYTADEHGVSSQNHSYNGSESTYSSESAVESHATNGIAPAPVVAGTVPRLPSTPPAVSEEAKDAPAV